MTARLKTAVLGATGYSGVELKRLLARHPRVGPPLLLSRSGRSENPAEGIPVAGGNGHAPSHPFSWSLVEEHGVELLFLATPHEVSRELVPEAIARGLRVVDLSGAWRLKKDEHRAVYGFKDADASVAAQLDARAVYGLPELNADQIHTASLVANPGCYATSVILALAPLLCGEISSTASAELFPIPSPEYPARGKSRPRARTSFLSRTIFPLTPYSAIVIREKFWSS